MLFVVVEHYYIITHTHTRIRQCFRLSKEQKKNQQHTDKRRRVKKDDIIQTREQFQQPSAFSSLIYMNVEHRRSMHTNRFKTHHNTLHDPSICVENCSDSTPSRQLDESLAQTHTAYHSRIRKLFAQYIEQASKKREKNKQKQTF